jgi:hypothetical protein
MMKLRSTQSAVIITALLLIWVTGCKLSGSTTSSTGSKSDSSKKTNSDATSTSSKDTNSTSSAPAPPPPDIAGKYDVAGSNPDGGGYKGTLEVIAHGDVFQFRWNAGTQYDGVGVVNGNVVAVAFANGPNGKGCGVIDYEIGGDGALNGRWGYWGVNDAGSEKASRAGGSGGLAGDYDASGKNPDGKEYKARLTVEPAGNLYRFVWSNNTDGVGIKQGSNVAVGIGGARCGFVAYEMSSSGLDGIWGGYGSDKTGTEKATRQ